MADALLELDAAHTRVDELSDRVTELEVEKPPAAHTAHPRHGHPAGQGARLSPIRAADRARYPADWRQISDSIRFGRAGGQCECGGECGHPHAGGRCAARHQARHPITGSVVVLTVAHLDHTPENNDEANLRAMCQRCHLGYDGAHHLATATRTRFLAATFGMEPLFNLHERTPP